MLTAADTQASGSEPVVLDPIFANHLGIADFVAGLSQRLLAETRTDGVGPDDEYLRGYARALSDLSESLIAGDMRPGGMFCLDRPAL